ncbi:hypothetical protein BDN70DRAFT_321097 [Pholiota conissans]|uniref:Uncharacterized protein n=1 Tax=Pholiota conissans TaxID=109636 RepID=A0A9P5YSI1_9AGAR|nr:hypothetical protein BDN70DRAFT_321097 [Pholiota conissans]
MDMNSTCHVWAHGYAAYLRHVDRLPSLFSCVRFSEFENLIPCEIPNCTCRALELKYGKSHPPLPWFSEISELQATVPKLSEIIT